MKNDEAPRAGDAHEQPLMQSVGSGSSGSTLSFEAFWRDAPASTTPRTDAETGRWNHLGQWEHEIGGWSVKAEYARSLEKECVETRKQLTLARAAIVAAHSAMLGKVNPKHPAWGCIYAVEDASARESNTDAEPQPRR